MTAERQEASAHSPDKMNFSKRFENYACDGFSIAVLRLDADNKIPPFVHQHDEYEFMIPITAMPGLKNEKALYFGEPGVVYPVLSGRTHGIEYELVNVSNCNIAVNKHKFEEIYKRLNIEGPVTFNYEFTLSEKLSRLMKLFKEEYLKENDKSQQALECISVLICIELIRDGANAAIDLRHVQQTFHMSISDAADYLLMHCCQKISLEELSARFGLSKYHFIRKFTQVAGESPYSFVLRARISKAKQMLEFENIAITEIACKCGFATTSHFSDFFRKKTGQSPLEYRNAYKTLGSPEGKN